MFRTIKKSECHISVDLEQSLTGYACSQLFIELLKYVIYQKQQIPLSCDSLIKLYENSKPTVKNYSVMQNFVDSLRNISNHLNLNFALDGCDIKQIIIIIGATIFSPKLCIIVEIPPNILNSNVHLDYQHSFRKPLLSVMRSIFECAEFQDEMTIPVGLKNTFVLIRKKDFSETAEFFIPKPQFSLPSQNIRTFYIKLNYNENNELNCNCENLVKVHHDSFNEKYTEKNCINEKFASQVDYQWYQSEEVLRGFKL